MILAIDTSTAACTAALFDGGGCVARCDEVIGRGHAERLVPMIAQLLDGRIADEILVGAGPGSFTGIRVGIAAAQGLSIGWDAQLSGMSSLALIAAAAPAGDGRIAAAMSGGHGELFVQQFDHATLEASSEVQSLPPTEAAAQVTADIVCGPAAEQLVEVRGWGKALHLWPSASNALALPARLRQLAPEPIYVRAPDAKVKSAA